MDRLQVVTGARLGLLVALLFGAGCDRGGAEKKEPPATGDRVDSVVAGQDKQVSVEEFCDVRAKSAAAAPPLDLPALAGGQAAPGKGSWRWVNLWATWCKPCIEEMPHLAKWQKDLAAKGLRFDLVFVSVDDSDDLVTRFRERHPDAPPSLRLADPDALPKWLAAIGLGESAPIPVHVFVDPDDRVRCVRAGGVKERDLPAVRAILGST
jgi:thiol-disulfide isomerase/thioredoxin